MHGTIAMTLNRKGTQMKDQKYLDQLAAAERRALSRAAPQPSHGKTALAPPKIELDPSHRARSVDDIIAKIERGDAAEREATRARARVRKAIDGVERQLGSGDTIGGTGFTILKYREPTISRLVSSHKIGQEELQAISEIEAVYGHLCSKLILRGASVGERLDRRQPHMPTWFLDAYFERYKPWAKDWSKRRITHNDHTLEIVYDILFSQRTGKDIDREKGWRNGLAMQAFLGGIRDYAAMGGWVSRTVGQQWAAMAREVFPMRRVPRVAS